MDMKYQMTNVKFYNYDCEKDTKTLLVDVPIDKIIKNSCSLNCAEYLEKEQEQFNDNVVVKKLGEILKFLPKSKKQASYGKDNGAYPFYTSSQTNNKYCNEHDYDVESLIIGTGGSANIKYGVKF